MSLSDLLRAEAEAFGSKLKTSSAKLQTATADAIARLTAAAGQPGFMEAVHAEALTIAALAAFEVVEDADALDASAESMIIGFLAGAVGRV